MLALTRCHAKTSWCFFSAGPPQDCRQEIRFQLAGWPQIKCDHFNPSHAASFTCLFSCIVISFSLLRYSTSLPVFLLVFTSLLPVSLSCLHSLFSPCLLCLPPAFTVFFFILFFPSSFYFLPVFHSPFLFLSSLVSAEYYCVIPLPSLLSSSPFTRFSPEYILLFSYILHTSLNFFLSFLFFAFLFHLFLFTFLICPINSVFECFLLSSNTIPPSLLLFLPSLLLLFL